MRRVVAVGDVANVTREPVFTMPDQVPGALWERVEFAADMPAGTWLLLYVPLPASEALFDAEMPRSFRVEGGTPGARTGYVAFAPFLVQDDGDGIVPETYFQEMTASFPETGPWSWQPEGAEVVPFAGTHYAGILAFAAATTDWRLNLTLEAPWDGDATVGPEVASWGAGFQVHTVPRMPEPAEGGASAQLDWSAPYGEGWLTVLARSACYVPTPCADFVAQEDWNVTLPQGILKKSFHRSATSGRSPHGLFGAMAAPAGLLAVEGSLSGRTGERSFHVLHAPMPPYAWPFPFDDTRFDQP